MIDKKMLDFIHAYVTAHSTGDVAEIESLASVVAANGWRVIAKIVGDNDKPALLAVIEAAKRAQQTSNLDWIARILRSNIELGRGDRELLARLFEGHTLKKKRGNQRTPIGNVKLEYRYQQAEEHVDALRKSGKTLDEAVAIAAERLPDAKRKLVRRSSRTKPARRVGTKTTRLLNYINGKLQP